MGGKILCDVCKKKCSGNVLRVQERYFHFDCFKCAECKSSLAQGGFFLNKGLYYCSKDYQRLFGTRCAECNEYVEGNVVTAIGNTYHQKCFACSSCRQSFSSGEKVTNTGKQLLCTKCIQIPIVSPNTSAQESQIKNGPSSHKICSGCKEELKEGQALIALEKEWHIWCFKCTSCKSVLHGEYMDKDGVPYCEKDYQKQFGVKCNHCDRYISGKVLRAGDNHHFHPTCARCSKCGDPFGDGEEMYLQAGAIWHPRCGPSPEGKLEDDYLDDHKLNGTLDSHYSPYSPSLSSSRSTSPYSSLRQYGRTSPGMFLDKDPLITDLSRVYTFSYLAAEPTQGYLRRPIQPHPPKSPQFFRPPDSSRNDRRSRTPSRPQSKQGMQVLVDTIQSTTPRPRSPHMNNEEPINLAHYPDATKPNPKTVAPIERDDFPAPPFPYTDPERRRRWSGGSKEYDELDDEEKEEDPQLKKEEEELTKIATGIGKVFLKNVKEREKLKAWKRANLDPRNASRTPSAKLEPPSRLRYNSSIHASPSRDIDRPRPWEDDEFDRGSGYRSSFGRSSGNTPSYNIVSSLRPIPKPGYGFATKSATLPAAGREGGMGYMTSDLAFVNVQHAQSSEFGSGKSDLSPILDMGKLHNASAFRSTPYSEGYTFRYASYSPHLRLSMPNVNLHTSKEPPKLYPYHLLVTGNYRLPPDADRCHLERHLSNDEFQAIFHMSRLEFYRLPEWRRNDLKKRAKMF